MTDLIEYIVLDNTGPELASSQIRTQITDIYPDKQLKFIQHHSSSIKDLVTYFSLKNRYPNTDNYNDLNINETELNHAILLFINKSHYQSNDTGLNSLSLDDLQVLISDFFHHLNVIVNVYDNAQELTLPQRKVIVTEKLLAHRQTRVLSWIGLGEDLKDSAINSMVDDLSCALLAKERNFTDLLVKEIDYLKLLNLRHPDSFYIDMIYEWGFKSHYLSYDELMYCAKCIIEIAINNCGEKYQLCDVNRLLGFCFNVRDNYRMGNQFHNFRHAVDVLQLTFYLLVKLDCLPNKTPMENKNLFLSQTLLPPTITLTLLIASFGHDIGHPGLTNKFLVDNKTPIAKYFNDISVLESFHYKEFRSILDKFFPEFFNDVDGSEEIVQKSILSTDMINHFAYIERIDDFMKYQRDVDNDCRTDNNVVMEVRQLLCSLLIKCADISNVSRPLEVSLKWGVSLTNETNEIQSLERNLHLPDPDFSKDFPHTITDLKTIKPEEVVMKLPSICKGQCFFIKNFVIMFFEKIQIILPELQFLYQHINENTEYWEKCDIN